MKTLYSIIMLFLIGATSLNAQYYGLEKEQAINEVGRPRNQVKIIAGNVMVVGSLAFTLWKGLPLARAHTLSGGLSLVALVSVMAIPLIYGHHLIDSQYPERMSFQERLEEANKPSLLTRLTVGLINTARGIH